MSVTSPADEAPEDPLKKRINGKDVTELPLTDAVTLFARVGAQAIADVPLPDETVPVSGQWRVDPTEWARYRFFCGEPQQFNRRALAWA